VAPPAKAAESMPCQFRKGAINGVDVDLASGSPSIIASSADEPITIDGAHAPQTVHFLLGDWFDVLPARLRDQALRKLPKACAFLFTTVIASVWRSARRTASVFVVRSSLASAAANRLTSASAICNAICILVRRMYIWV
jgi:hypothetical protein